MVLLLGIMYLKKNFFGNRKEVIYCLIKFEYYYININKIFLDKLLEIIII